MRVNLLTLLLISCGAPEPEWTAAANNPSECPDPKSSRCVGDGTAPCPAGLSCSYENATTTAVVSCDSAVCKTYNVK